MALLVDNKKMKNPVLCVVAGSSGGRAQMPVAIAPDAHSAAQQVA